MNIEERTVGEVTVLDLKGKMLIGEGDELLREKVNGLVEGGTTKILLTLPRCPMWIARVSARSCVATRR